MGTAFTVNEELCASPRGGRNLITDVPGVRVGHVTVNGRAPRDPYGRDPDSKDSVALRTGVTAIVPPGDCFADKLPAGAYVSNGFGKSMGLVQIQELGSLETPILLTNTLSCGACFDALTRYSLSRHPSIGVSAGTVNPVVMECNDGEINSIRSMAVTPDDGEEAIAEAHEDFAQGDVGAGTGMRCFGLKGGIGSSSRVLAMDGRDFTIGVLVMTNFGSLECLRISGEPLGMSLASALRPGPAASGESPAHRGRHAGGGWGGPDRHEDRGSIVTVVATDAPVDSRQLTRMAKRVTVGIARCGGYIGNGSGEIVVAFSTANRIDHWAGSNHHGRYQPLVSVGERLNENAMDICFRAVAAASEEAIVSSLVHAHTVTGYDGRVTPCLSDAMRQAGLAMPAGRG